MPKEAATETTSSPILTRDTIESVFGIVAEKKDGMNHSYYFAFPWPACFGEVAKKIYLD